ncbi:MAG: SprB repeat-containing protein [Saprospiraceae bacterium]
MKTEVVDNIGGPSLSATKVDVSCNGLSDGSINLSVSGGTSPYTYVWSNGASTQDLNNIPAGTYTVTVSDANNCTATLSRTINQPNPLNPTAVVTAHASCEGNADGSGNLAYPAVLHLTRICGLMALLVRIHLA